MNFHHYAVASTLEGRSQVIPQGPVAALEMIKNLGTNGGGFFNANGAHPYENPTPLTNFLELLAIILVPAALTNTFGRMVQQSAPGMAPLLGDAVSVHRRIVCLAFERTACQPAPSWP